MTTAKAFLLTGLVALLLPFGSARAQMQDGRAHQHDAMAMHADPGGCEGPELACAVAATPVFAPDGTLFLTWATARTVSLARSADKGAHFADPVLITPEPVRMDSGPDSRPQAVADGQGRVTVAFAVFQDAHWNGQVRVSRSTDGGAHFTQPQPITAGSPSQRFQSMLLAPDGRVFAAWLDKRNVAPARARGETYAGAALAFAWSGTQATDGPAFAPARIAADDTCECCRIGLGWAAPDRPVAAFRNIFGGTVRDHALTVFQDADTPGPVHRVSEDNWAVAACPHHGPSLAVGAGATIHVAWFSGGGVRKGVFVARTTDQGASFSSPVPVGDAGRQNSRPFLLAAGHSVWLAWKSFDGERTEVRLMRSVDDGASWGAAETIAATGGGSDHPMLISDGAAVYLSWMTRQDGYRLIPIGPSA